MNLKIFHLKIVNSTNDFAIRKIDRIIISDFPYATSPTIKRSVGYFLLKSSLISSMAEI